MPNNKERLDDGTATVVFPRLPGTLYVTFRPCSQRYISKICRWLHPEIGHCALIFKGTRSWIYLDPLTVGLGFREIATHDLEEDFPKFYAEQTGHKVLRFNRPRLKYILTWWPWFGLMNCTIIMKFIIGVKSRAFTPYGLYKDLVKNYGATKI